MMEKDYTTVLSVAQSPEEVFKAVNNVKGWWTKSVEGGTEKLNDEFEVRFGDVHYSRQKLVEVVPGKKVVWLITDSRLNFIKDMSEWTGTKIDFDITRNGNKTELRFTHYGLAPQVECYDACSGAWTGFIRNSLMSLITTGKGLPDVMS